MNFANMPELVTSWFYPGLMLFMLVLGLGMWWYFQLKGWVRQALTFERADFVPDGDDEPQKKTAP